MISYAHKQTIPIYTEHSSKSLHPHRYGAVGYMFEVSMKAVFS